MQCVPIDEVSELTGYSRMEIETAVKRGKLKLVRGLVTMDSLNHWMLERWKEDKAFEEDYMSFDF